jgi:hypothetical protein
LDVLILILRFYSLPMDVFRQKMDVFCYHKYIFKIRLQLLLHKLVWIYILLELSTKWMFLLLGNHNMINFIDFVTNHGVYFYNNLEQK